MYRPAASSRRCSICTSCCQASPKSYFVEESFVDTKAKVDEADLLCIGQEADAADLADAVIPAVDVEPMEMRIRPAKRNLERVVKISAIELSLPTSSRRQIIGLIRRIHS